LLALRHLAGLRRPVLRSAPTLSAIAAGSENRRAWRQPPRHIKKLLGEIALQEIAMSSRRHFLKAGAAAAATGIVFCGCGLSKSAPAQTGSRAKLPVTVSGKRVKTVDVHAHCHFREAGALLGEEGFKLQVSAINGATETYIDLSQRLAAMDAQAVDMEILSINPFWYNRERDVAAQIV